MLKKSNVKNGEKMKKYKKKKTNKDFRKFEYDEKPIYNIHCY